MHHPNADIDRLYLMRKEGGRGMLNLEMTFKATTIGLQTYLNASNDDWMMKLVERHETSKKLHSVIKQARKFKEEFDMDDTEEQTNLTATNMAKKKESRG